MKQSGLFTIFAVATMLLAACGGSDSTTGDNGSSNGGGETEEYTAVWDVSLPLGPDSHQDVGVQAFGEKIAELTDGRITIQPHFNNSLGGEREAVEGLSIDSIDMAITSTGPLGGFVNEFFMFDLPYLFESKEHAYAVLDSEIGDELAEMLATQANVMILGWMENGVRHNTNSVRPITHPDDLQGINHRTQESEVQVDTWTALGANATPMAWPEVYTALQQGVMGSQENPLPTIYDVNFFEVQDYLNLTAHVYSPAPLMISKQLFDSLSPEDQALVIEAAEYATPIQREASTEQEIEMLQLLQDEGMELTEPDLGPFRVAVEPVYEKWAPQIGEDLIERARNFEY
ncbi:DctP family TRAP transporter solute-binding subunit [Halalkalibacterium ligniniphilum]|uniref:DctP family TRAP transporter solute-binding subunit n=1 Tax=Halalkalibacterium ligniniphilum TaxID=1134413 RepID=UPI0003449561|nr:DctP family TRAP transporter solute-binding subunit [Halalkalibacterium ligniniphilum]